MANLASSRDQEIGEHLQRQRDDGIRQASHDQLVGKNKYITVCEPEEAKLIVKTMMGLSGPIREYAYRIEISQSSKSKLVFS
jgi:hypothetical protein